MSENEKMPGSERRQLLVDTLQAATKPMTGKELGDMTECQPTSDCWRYYIAKGKK